jgi:hypothetical protein
LIEKPGHILDIPVGADVRQIILWARKPLRGARTYRP